MDFLTRQLGKIVFSVDLTDLPDETRIKRVRRALGENCYFYYNLWRLVPTF